MSLLILDGFVGLSRSSLMKSLAKGMQTLKILFSDSFRYYILTFVQLL